MTDMTALLQHVTAWIDADPDEASREELTALVAQAHDDAEAAAELADRFAATLQFGTAGLRGAMAAGPNRMNRAVVMGAAKGLIDYLNDHVERPRVVIGNDARHHSRQFALDTAAIVTAAGGQALLLPDQVPTPLLAYSVRHLNADAGVMVTASHNPAADNGYKVYLGGRIVSDPEAGCQIIPPYDTEIAACIAAAPPAKQIARADGWTDLGDEVLESYIAAISAPLPSDGEELPLPPIRIVHTAMHGVGSSPALEALSRAGFSTVVPVLSQEAPDPDFPTVPFPNPEEPGAIDMALALAAQLSADVLIANDPDADRCAVAVKDPRKGWRMLHGDELGAILGEEIARQASGGVLVNSIVSSRHLSAIASHYGVTCVNTLTGFKWMGRVPSLAYAYEEAIGYCVRPDLVHDKDGLSCAVAVARLVARLKAEGKTIIDLLDDLARRDGLYLSSQLSARFEDLSHIGETMARLRQTPPQSLAGIPIATVIDLNEGYEGLPPTDGILLFTVDQDRVIVRPSGTEPKVKSYLEVILPVDPQATFDDITDVRRTAEQRLSAIKEDLNTVLFM